MLGARLSPRWGYLAIGALTIALTWLTDLLSVISIASRAFALFFALQCSVSVITALRRVDAPHRRWIMAAGTLLALVSISITILGIPAE